jgi:CRISPR-associated endonuclease/helicase Cas3
MTAIFDDVFQKLTGHAPYPWQRRLYARFVAGGKYDALDIPTGLGKTSVMTVWLLTHLLGEAESRPPMRLIYVVNRRTIVDQATNIAVELQKRVGSLEQWRDRFGETELCVSTLRGALADKGDWLLVPHQPAIIVGTVDMIGSRLLFNGYRTGRWQRSRHAGLLGWDSLLVHDEAHLSGPFQTLIEWVILRQGESGRRLQIMPMSATAGRPDEDDVLRIDSEDRQIARGKLQAIKRVHLHPDKGKPDPVKLAELALRHEGANARVIIFTRLPDIAAKVVGELKKKKMSGERIALLTGTIRGFERDELVKNPVLKHLLESIKPDATEYLVATSAGEVGADFDADHIVCDLSTIDAMIQRFGRVNRRGGEGREASIDVLLDIPAAKADKGGPSKNLSPIENARIACAVFLEALQAEQGEGFDASPEAIEKWRGRPGYAEACEPPTPTATPHDVVLDAWSLTSIQEDWPVAQDVDPYLHGLEDSQPETYVAWRAELDEWGSSGQGDLDARAMEQMLAHYPLRPRELLRDKPEIVAEMLLKMQPRCSDKPMMLIRNRRAERLDMGKYPDAKALAKAIGYCAVILPTSAGGLSLAGMIDADNDLPAKDVADETTGEDGHQEIERQRVILDRNDDDEWSGRLIPSQTDRVGETFEKWSAARDRWMSELNKLKMRYTGRIILCENEDEESVRILLFFVKNGRKAAEKPQKLTVARHNQDVYEAVQRIIEQIEPSQTEAAALCVAARDHDLGKGWDCAEGAWQKAVGNQCTKEAWAKTFEASPNWKLLDGYRHEFGSLRKAIESDGMHSLDESTCDLALHLIAVHHGRGRPYFDREARKTPPGDLPDELKPAETARRFDRLQRRYGHWGLAWLESLLMAADAEASRSVGSEPNQDGDVATEEDR